MALSDLEIWMELQSGDLGIEPLDAASVGPSSVDLHLDSLVLTFAEDPGGSLRLRDIQANQLLAFATREVRIDGEGVELKPGDLMIGFTRETVRLPSHICAWVEGRSSFARVGLSIHNTAPMI